MGLFNREPQLTTATTTETRIPAEVAPFFERNLRQAESVANMPYYTYGGQRLAERPEDSLYADTLTRQLAGSGLGALEQAQGVFSGIAGQQAPSYTAGQFGYDQVGPFDPLTARQWSSAEAQQYMDPYIGSVLNAQRDLAFQDWQRSQKDINTIATSTGNFGAGRHGIYEAMGREELTRRLGQLEAEGLSGAYRTGQQAFASDRDAQLLAQRTGLEALLQSQLANQGAGLQAQQYGEQSRQFGAGLGLDYLNSLMSGQLAAGEGLLNTQQLRDALQSGRINLLNQQGDRQFAYDQTGRDVAYEDFINQRDYPRQNVAFMNAILQGLPVQPSSTVSTYQKPPSLASQILGTVAAGIGAYNTYGGGEGG